MVKRKCFPIYFDWFGAFDELDDKQLGALIRAMMDYCGNGEEPKCGGVVQGLFEMVRPRLDRAVRR